MWLIFFTDDRYDSFLDDPGGLQTPVSYVPERHHEDLGIVPPRKTHRKSASSKRKLFESDTDSSWAQLYKNISDALPDVCQALFNKGLLDDFHTLVLLIRDDVFPLDNIALKLLLEVARWYGLESSTQMFYSTDTLLFWRVLYKLYHGGILRFLTGNKMCHDSESSLNPKESKINFAVPSPQVIRSFEGVKCLPKELPPGIISETLDMKQDSHCSHILSVDGKKVASGLNKDWGDINLFGFEQQSFTSLQNKIKTELHDIDELHELVNACRRSKNASPQQKQATISKAFNVVHNISCHIKDLRHIGRNQYFALQKFRKLAGGDWRNSRYVFAISSIQATLHQSEVCAARLLEINKRLGLVISCIHGSEGSFCNVDHLDVSYQPNFVRLKDPLDIESEDLRYLKQRSNRWYHLRSAFRVTGSIINQAIGLDTLSKQNQHIKNVSSVPIRGKADILKVEYTPNTTDDCNSESRSRVFLNEEDTDTTHGMGQQSMRDIYMQHGVENEINGLATLAGRIMPFFFPGCTYQEEGVHIIGNDDESPLILVSPDGSISRGITQCPDATAAFDPPKPIIAVEIKCPYPNKHSLPVHYDVPKRYIPQLLAEMKALGVEKLIYSSWSNESSTAFLVKFDAQLWTMIHDEVCRVYGNACVKRLSRISEESKLIRTAFETFTKRNVKFLGEFPSITARDSNITKTSATSPFVYPLTTCQPPAKHDDMDNLVEEMQSALNETMQLSRRKATEVLVWMLSDADRFWHAEIPHALPIAYAMKGYSLPVSVMRDMTDDVLQACHDHHIHVACTCFDGQWIGLANRSATKQPLTLLQLRRDIWENVKKATKEELLQQLIQVQPNNSVSTKGTYGMVVSCDILRRFYACYKHQDCEAISESEGLSEDLSYANDLPEKANAILECEPNAFEPQNEGHEPGTITNDIDLLVGKDLSYVDCLPEEAIDIVQDDPNVLEQHNIENESGMNVINLPIDNPMDINVIAKLQQPYNETPQSKSTQPCVASECSPVMKNDAVLTRPAKACSHKFSPDEVRDILNQLRSHKKETVRRIWMNRCDKDVEDAISNIDITQKITVSELETVLSVADIHKSKIAGTILKQLRDHENQNIASKWQYKTVEQLFSAATNHNEIEKFDEHEKVILLPWLEWFRRRSTQWKKSWPKHDKVNAVSHIYGSCVVVTKDRQIPQMLSLREQCANAISKPKSRMEAGNLSKYALNIVAAFILCRDHEKTWNEISTVANPLYVAGLDEYIHWFSYPEYNAKRDKLEPKCLDGDHLLVNLRVKVCRDGLPGYGVSRNAWIRVAETHPDVLSPALAIDLIDRQNNAYARQTFSLQVEECMFQLGFPRESAFCSLVRNWYAAEDDPGISAHERAVFRMQFRKFLLRDVELMTFPPPKGGYIHGMPQTMFEGIIQSIDTHLQLYAVCFGGTYNQRSVSSLVNETFFGELGEMEATKHGCPKAVAIPRLMSSVTEVMHYRHNPNDR